jgi:hypothetical protein
MSDIEVLDAGDRLWAIPLHLYWHSDELKVRRIPSTWRYHQGAKLTGIGDAHRGSLHRYSKANSVSATNLTGPAIRRV